MKPIARPLCRLLCLCSAILCVASSARADALRVPEQYPSIQAAIDASAPGDEVWVLPGIYLEALNFRGKAIRVVSVEGPDVTEIVAPSAGSVVLFRTGEGPDSILEGFTIRGGNGTAQGLVRYGGGIQIEACSPTIRGNVIRDNAADFGGGISCWSRADATIVDNRIASNRAISRGGGIYCDDFSFPSIRDNEIIANDCDLTGGGIYLFHSSPVIEGNSIRENRAVGGGGGVYCDVDSHAVLRNNELIENIAESASGGGVAFIECAPYLFRNLIRANQAQQNSDGGGVYCFKSDARISENLIVDNTSGYDGGGIFVWFRSHPILEANVIRGNFAAHGGGGIAVSWYSMPEILDNVVSENTVERSGGGLSFFSFSEAFVSGNEVVGNVAKNAAGALINEASPTLVNNVMTGNVASVNGGAIYMIWESEPILVNNTFVGNAAATGGGIHASRAYPVITNSIFYGNQADVAPEIQVSAAANVQLSHCVIPGGWPGTGNLDIDPKLVSVAAGDVHLRFDSPCVDRGTSVAPIVGQKDKDGEDRLVDGDGDGMAVIDLGALEMAPHNAARYGSVNAANGDLADVLFVNGSAGDARRVVEATPQDPIEVSVIPTPAGPNPAPFVLYAWEAEPDRDTLVSLQPRGLGVMCFDSPLSSGSNKPFFVWNNLGWRQHLGVPGRASLPAPSTVFETSRVGYEVTLTLQGFIADAGSAADGPLSITNAIVIRVTE